jgi:hypothetical protein
LLAREPFDLLVEKVFGQRKQVGAGVNELLVGQVHAAHEDLAPQCVDALTLLVHHVVVLEQVFADGEVLRLDLLLRTLDRARHHPVLDGDAFLHPEPLHQTGNALRSEDAHQVVFEGEIKAG